MRSASPVGRWGLVVLAGLLAAVHCDRHAGVDTRERIHYPRGEEARLAGDYDTAISEYLKSIAAAPRDPRSYFGLVEAHLRRGDLDSVEPILRAMLETDPRNPCVPGDWYAV